MSFYRKKSLIMMCTCEEILRQKDRAHQNGFALYPVLGLLVLFTVLTTIMLKIVLGQSQFSQNKARRIQSYYSARAALVYAFEKLRTADPVWLAGGDFTMCANKSCNVFEPDLPKSVGTLRILVSPPNEKGTQSITVKADYTE